MEVRDVPYEMKTVEGETQWEEFLDVKDENGRDLVFPVPPFRRSGERVGRNDPCPCGSTKKFKKCCLLLGQHLAQVSITADPEVKE